MSLQHVPPLSQAATDFESDSDYLGTPVDPPSNCHPCVADYEPLTDYYYSAAAHDNPNYSAAHSGAQYVHSANSGILASSPQHALLFQTNHPMTAPEDCNQSAPDSAIAAYHLIPPNHHTTNVDNAASTVRHSSHSPASSADLVPSLVQVRPTPSSRARSSVELSLYPEYEGEDPACRDKVGYMGLYSKTGLRQLDLTCNTTVSYPSTVAQTSYQSVCSSSLNGNAPYLSRAYYDDAYADSPIDDQGYCDRFPDQGCTYDQHSAYDQYHQHPRPHPDTHFTSGTLQSHQNVRFYQPPSCPYSYPCIDPPSEGSEYGSSPILHSSSAYAYPVIHAPRPQQLHDIHTLHSSTCPPQGSFNSLMSPHRVLSIPSVPAPPPIPRPTSLIEDSPKKPLTLACYFCRKRKIACQSPPANAQDRTCNQCAKRKLKCVYPATSRRGIRPRVYDLSDDNFRRPSLPL